MRLYTRKINPKGSISISTSSSEDKYFEEIDSKTCCKNPKITESEGYRVCHNCGFIFSQIYDDTPRRSYTNEEKNNRVMNEVVYTPIGPRTVINGNKDANGRLLDPKYIYFYRKLSKINKSIFSSYERNFYIAFPVFERISERLSLPDNIIKDALKIYKYAVEKKMTLGRSIESLISASIYCVIRIYGIPITMEEVIEITNVPKKKCVRDFSLVRKIILPNLNFKVKVKHLTPEKYIYRFSQDLNLSMKCSNTALKMLKEAIKNGYNISGRDPKGIAAALLYNASQLNGEGRTQKEICDKSLVTQVTLRNRRRELSSCLPYSK
ncbi:MAG: transcription initiation factor IIB family protein [Promethearchaeota archaeon]